jgi:hypothetical protein
MSGVENGGGAGACNVRLVSSDSEYSDAETTKPREAEAAVRRESLETLKSAFRCLPRDVLTSFWWAFMPTISCAGSMREGEKGQPDGRVSDGWTLTSALLQEPDSKCRFSAAVALDAYFRPCKIFLAVAEGRSVHVWCESPTIVITDANVASE